MIHFRRSLASRTNMLSAATARKHSVSSTGSIHKKISEYLAEDEKMISGTHPELEDVLARNKDYISKKMQEHPEYFKRTGAAQSPKYLYIGCSDARVNPNQIFGCDHDEIFVTRNIGNQVAPGDLNVLSVMEFSLGFLKIPHVVVCGHTECGAVKGALARQKDGGLGFLEHWLGYLRNTARMHHEELNQITDAYEKETRFAELNVMEQCLNVLKTPIVQKLRAQSYNDNSTPYALPRVHGVVYDVKTGELKKVDLPFKQDIAKYRAVYDLEQVSQEAKVAEFWDNVR